MLRRSCCGECGGQEDITDVRDSIYSPVVKVSKSYRQLQQKHAVTAMKM